MKTQLSMNQPATYQIQVQGRLPKHWSEVFDQMQVQAAECDGEVITTLSGPVADQAALHGVLQALYTLGLPVRMVYCDLPEELTG